MACTNFLKTCLNIIQTFPSKYPPPLFIHSSQRFPFQEHVLELFFWCTGLVPHFYISYHLKVATFQDGFNSGNIKTSARAKSGEYGSRLPGVTLCSAKTHRNKRGGALSWFSFQVLFLRSSDLFHHTVSLKHFMIFKSNHPLTV